MVEVGHGALSRVIVEGLLEPAALLVGVVAPGRVTGPGAEVAEVAGGVRSVVFVVAYRGLGARLLRSPGGVVAVSELRSSASRIDVVPEGEDGPRYTGQHVCRGLIAVVVAGGDVSRAD